MAYVISGIGLVVVWPFVGMMTAFAHDRPNVSAIVEIARRVLAFTLLAIPLVWIISLVTALIISRWKIELEETRADQLVEAVIAQKTRQQKKEKLLNACAAAPYVAATLHLVAWMGLMLVRL